MKIEKPIINPNSQKIIDSIIINTPQSLLITGEHGVGISTIAIFIAQQKNIKPTVILPEKKEKIDLIDGKISVDIMRRLYDQTRTKHPDGQIIIIDYAERMTQQAQNAFLKLLEEPGINIIFILVSHSTAKLLPTILSRTSLVEIRPISTSQSMKLLDDLGVIDATKKQQLLFIADGLPAELTKLSNDSDYFEKRSSVVIDAREMLKSDLYQKTKIINKYKDSRVDTLLLLIDMANMLKRTANANPNPEIFTKIKSILCAYEQIESNCNIRLVLLKTVI